MGSSQTKDKSNTNEKMVEGFKYKVRFLQAEVNEIMCMREHESQVYAQEMIISALKEAEWKKERNKLKDEVKKLRKKLEENHESVKEVSKELSTSYLLKQIRVYDVAIEKWKQLYLAIKIELDDLIQRTNQAGEVCMELLEKLKEKEEIITLLKERIASMEKQQLKRERDADILRQSLKIISYNMKTPSISKNLSKSVLI